MGPRKKKPLLPRPLDANQTAYAFVRMVTGEPLDQPPVDHEAARELGRQGGKKGGKARAAKLSSAERSQSARKAALARWKAKPDERP